MLVAKVPWKMRPTPYQGRKVSHWSKIREQEELPQKHTFLCNSHKGKTSKRIS